MADFIQYILASIGLMCILKYGSILDWPRTFLTARFEFFDDLFHCSLCLGFWSGISVTTFIYFCDPPWDPIYWLFPFTASLFCWVSDSLIGILKDGEVYLREKSK